MKRRDFITLLGGAAASMASCPRNKPHAAAAMEIISFVRPQDWAHEGRR